jgi:hypothetical protein
MSWKFPGQEGSNCFVLVTRLFCDCIAQGRAELAGREKLAEFLEATLWNCTRKLLTRIYTTIANTVFGVFFCE